MLVKKIPYGVSNYRKIIEEKRAYVDKTMYIRALEDADDYILFLRPRRFGKSLFTSTLGYYYDIARKDNFDFLFSSTNIGRNPTEKKTLIMLCNLILKSSSTASYNTKTQIADYSEG